MCVLKETWFSKIITPSSFSSVLSVMVVFPTFIDKSLLFSTRNNQVALVDI